jgi:hypothetical protein
VTTPITWSSNLHTLLVVDEVDLFFCVGDELCGTDWPTLEELNMHVLVLLSRNFLLGDVQRAK